jgi:hypothetical protein
MAVREVADEEYLRMMNEAASGFCKAFNVSKESKETKKLKKSSTEKKPEHGDIDADGADDAGTTYWPWASFALRELYP